MKKYLKGKSDNVLFELKSKNGELSDADKTLLRKLI